MNMETIHLDEFEAIKYMNSKRDILIEDLNEILKSNDSTIDKTATKLLKVILQLNKHIKLLHYAFLIKQNAENKIN